MKILLKMIDSELDHGETFNSKKNLKIRRCLIPELRKALAPNYRPSANQLTNWLNCLHKSRRSKNKIRKSGKIVTENRRVHNNSRIQEVIISYVNFCLFY